MDDSMRPRDLRKVADEVAGEHPDAELDALAAIIAERAGVDDVRAHRQAQRLIDERPASPAP